MPMLAIFGAEVLAAEVAAATAAEIAAAEAAKIAAAEAASVAAAETAAAAAAQTAAQQTAQAGIMEIGNAAANAPLTAEAVQSAAMNSGLPPGFEQQLQNVQNLSQGPSVQLASADPSAGIKSLADVAPKGSLDPSTGRFIDTTLRPEPVFQNIGGQGVTTPQTFPVNDGGITPISQVAPPAPNTLPMGIDMPGTYTPPSNALYTPPASTYVAPPSGLEAGFDKAVKFAEKNPFTAMTLAYTGANALGLMNPSGATFNQEKYDGPLSKYKLSPNFQAGSANPANFQYQPRYATGGGIMDASGYDIPVGYDEGGPVLSLPPRVTRSSDAFRVPGAAYDPAQVASANAYNDILRNRVYADNRSGRADDPMYGVADARQLETTANSTVRGHGPMIARNELLNRSNEGEFAAPGYGDLGQFAGGFGNSMGMGGGGGKYFDDQSMATMAMAKGGSLSESIESYQKMLAGKPQAAPSRPADVGIYYDQDPDTRYQDALTAAQIRQSKVNQRAYVSPPAAKRPTPMGQLQMASVKPRKQGSDDVEAASGGIMQSSLGGYAAGGNPRLLKGPGDGMSDNIPATINRRQPARLADGEFVIPADVVSHLGNGSTEAGAKQLHAMMDKVRKARTGNPKQGKQINARKYMPK